MIGAGAMSMPRGTLQNDRGQSSDAKIQPMVMVFDSKARHRRKHRPKLKKPKTTLSPPAFTFINVSHPDEDNEDCRRLIKTHVMQSVLRRAEKLEARSMPNIHSELSMPEDEPSKNIHVQSTTWSMENSPRAPPSSLIVFPVQMQPYMPRLLINCA